MTLRVTPQEIVDEAEASGRPGLLVKAPRWPRMKVERLARIVNGAPFASSRFNLEGRGVPLVRIRDVGSRSVSTWYDGPWDESHRVRHGDLLVGMDGNFTVARWHLEDAVLNQRVCRLDVIAGVMDERFLELVIQGYLDAIWDRTSSTTVKHLSSRTIGQIPLPTPSLKEQCRIVEVLEEHLSSLDRAMSDANRANARVEVWLQTLLRSTLSEGAEVSFDEVFQVLPLPVSNAGVRTASPEGRWPIVDQGESAAPRRTDKAEAVFRGPLPVVVFGDHTRRIKLVGDEFAVGGSGVKLLAPKRDMDPQFAYWAAKAVALPSRGYGRHFALLRNAKFQTGDRVFQEYLVQQMTEAEAVVDISRRALRQVEEREAALRRALLEAAFSGRLTGHASDLDRTEEAIAS